MRTIVIQLMKSMIMSKDEYSRMQYYKHTMENYAPDSVYDYFIVGGSGILAALKADLLTNDLIPMLLKKGDDASRMTPSLLS